MGLPLVARSFTYLGPAPLALDSLQLSAPLSPRSLARADSLTTAPDCARPDPLLLAPDSLQLGLSSLLHSLAHPDMVLLVLDPVVLGPTSSAQNGIEGFDAGEFTGTQLSLSGFLRVGGMLVVLDSTRLDFPPAAPDLLHLELLLLLHSLARMESVSSVLDSVTLGLTSLAKSGLQGETSFDSLVGTSLFVSSLS